jgi:RNA-directed DNA polymerase
MTKGQEGSDGRVVPQGRRKAVPTSPLVKRGKATTASEAANQLSLLSETADSPRGAVPGTRMGLPRNQDRYAVPKSEGAIRGPSPAMSMTMEEVASEANLKWAFQQVERNDGAPGPDGQSVREVREHLPSMLRLLNRDLLDGSYRPGAIRRVWIPKTGGGQRGLGIPNVIDRLVQQAVHQVLGPHYEPTFHDSSHGFRPGRSCHTAIAEAREHLREGYEYVVDIDLEKFFDRVHHDRLLARLAESVADPRLLRLIRQMLEAKVVMPDGVVVSSEEGTPQGGPLSPLLSNIVLDELDRELAERGHRFVRYADDCNIYVRSERAGHRVMAGVVHFIETRLRLKVNLAKSAVARPEDRHFLGFSLRKNWETGAIEVLLSKRSTERLAEKIRELTPRSLGQSMDGCILRINAYARGWLGFFGVCTPTSEVLRTLQSSDAHIRRRLRAIQLRQWKRKRFMARQLIRLGARRETVWSRLYGGRKSLWALSHCGPVDYALGKAHFAARGLESLEAIYRSRSKQLIASVQLQLDLDNCGRKRRRRNKRVESRPPRRPEEPDVRPTSPVL